MKDLRSQYEKTVHNFITVTVILSCFILIAMGSFAAKNNTEALDSGIKPAMIYASREDEQISVTINKTVLTSGKLNKIPADTVLSLIPAPAGNIYLIYKNARELFLSYFPGN